MQYLLTLAINFTWNLNANAHEDLLCEYTVHRTLRSLYSTFCIDFFKRDKSRLCRDPGIPHDHSSRRIKQQNFNKSKFLKLKRPICNNVEVKGKRGEADL